MRRTLLPPEITRIIGACQLSRAGIVRVLTGLHVELPKRYDQLRHQRHPENDGIFVVVDAIADGGRMHEFTFLIDDSSSPEHLIVADLEHDSHPD